MVEKVTPELGMVKHMSFANKNKVFIVGDVNGLPADFADDVVSKVHNALFLCIGGLVHSRILDGNLSMELGYLEDICRKNDNIVLSVQGVYDRQLFFNEDTFKASAKAIHDYLTKVRFLDDYTVVSTVAGEFFCFNRESDFVDTTPMPGKSDEEDNDIELNPFNIEMKQYKISRVLTCRCPIKNDKKTSQLVEFFNDLKNNLGIILREWYHCESLSLQDIECQDREGTKFIEMRPKLEANKWDVRELT